MPSRVARAGGLDTPPLSRRHSTSGGGGWSCPPSSSTTLCRHRWLS